MTSKTKVNIKRLAKGMSLQDKAKLLFAHRNKYAETSSLEKILTQDEIDAIYKDARENDQMDELKRLDNLYKMANLLLADLEIACLSFEVGYQRFLGMLAAIYLNENALNLLWELIDDVAKTEKQKKALEKKWILEKYQKNLFVKDFSFTALQQTVKEKINEEENMSLDLPHFFIDTIERLKRYKKLKYQLDYIINEKVKIDFLSDKQKKRLKEYNDRIENFLKMKKLDSIVAHIYRNLERVRKSKFNQFSEKFTQFLEEFNQFFKMIKNIDKAVELTEQDKKEARKEIDAILNRHT